MIKSLNDDKKIRITLCSIGLLHIGFITQAASHANPIVSQGTNITDHLSASRKIKSNWTNFRGPGANGHAAHMNPPLTWNVEENRNIFWKTKMPKHGMSSPVVWEDQLFLTGADYRVRQIYCYDTETGRLQWTQDVNDIPGSPPNGWLPDVLEETGFAAPTLTTNGCYVAAIFGTGELVCVNLKGERIWAKHLGVPDNHYGHSSSLISHGNKLFVQYDQTEKSRLLAFDFTTGQLIWDVQRDEISWSSPILIDNKGRNELILTNCKAVDSYDPDTGTPLWRVACLGGEVASSAAYAEGIVYVANEGATASAIDIRKHDTEPKILWQWDETLPDASSPLANRDYLILPTAFGVVTCLEAKTSKVYWEHEFDEGFYSSPILVKDRVYIIDLSGTMQIFRMDKTFEQLGVGETGEDVYATPAFVGDRIYIRGVTHLFAIGE